MKKKERETEKLDPSAAVASSLSLTTCYLYDRQRSVPSGKRSGGQLVYHRRVKSGQTEVKNKRRR